AEIGPWQRVSFETTEREALSDFGRYSRTYTYQHREQPTLSVNVSLDFPYIGGWHDLCVCYRNTGWTINERSAATPVDEGDEEWSYIEGDLEDPTGARALILFGGFTVNGDLASPPSKLVTWRPWFRLRRRMLEHVSPQLMQVQALAVGDFAEQPALKGEILDLFNEVRRRFRDHVVEGGSEHNDAGATPPATGDS
ncbi:MAG: exosortase U, partial [Planctomycetota bacterium]